MDLLYLLKGKKTYLVVIVGIFLAGLEAQGFITTELYGNLLPILGLLGLGAVRNAIK